MLSEQLKNFALGGYLIGDPDLQTTFVEGLFKRADSAMFDEYRYTYDTARKNGAYASYMEAICYEAALNNEAIQNIEDEIIKGKTGEGFNVDKMLDAAKDIYKKPIDLGVDINTAIATYVARKKIKTGIKGLDVIMGDKNGIDNGRVYVFASKAKGGKSIVLQNLANSISYANPTLKVCYISLENDLGDIVDRHNEFIIPWFKTQEVGNYNVIFNPDLTLSDIKHILDNYDVIVVDYLARIQSEKKYESTYEQYGDYADQLHKMAVENNKIIITACQLSRAAIGNFKNVVQGTSEWDEAFKSVDQDAVADSMNILRNADTVIVTFKDDFTASQAFHNIASRTSRSEEAVKIEYIIQTQPQAKAKLKLNYSKWRSI